MVPSDLEYHQKEGARVFLERLTESIWPGAKLLPFGSMANGFALSGCDMDLCCLVPEGATYHTTPHEFVTKLGNLIKNETDFQVKILSRARIPIIKLVLPDGLSCDIGFENRLALENTRLLLTYAMIDPRLRIMVLLIKVWAKKRNINNPYRGTLSSYGFVLLVIHFLGQVTNPPVLPNLQQLATTNSTSSPTPTTTTATTTHSPTPNINPHPSHPPPQTQTAANSTAPSPSASTSATLNPAAAATVTAAGTAPAAGTGSSSTSQPPGGHNLAFFDDLEQLSQHWQGSNQDCTGQLVIDLFKYFATEFVYHQKVVSIRSQKGQLQRDEKHWYQHNDGDREGIVRDLHFLCIEDPFQLDYNVARTVTRDGLYSIRGEFLRGYRILSSRSPGEPIINIINQLLEPDTTPQPDHYHNATFYPTPPITQTPTAPPPPRRRSAPSPRLTNPNPTPNPNQPTPPTYDSLGGYDLHRFFQSTPPGPSRPPAPIFPERDRQAVALANEITFGNFHSRGRAPPEPDTINHRARGRSVPHFRLDKDGSSSILFGEIKVVIPSVPNDQTTDYD